MNLLHTLFYLVLVTISVTFVTCKISSHVNDLRSLGTKETYFDRFVSVYETLEPPDALKGNDVRETVSTQLLDIMADTKQFTQIMLKTHEAFAENDLASSVCVNDTRRLMKSVSKRQKWAWEFVDATGKIEPGLLLYRFNWVGNYAQCRSIVAPPMPSEGRDGFKGNYCVLKAALANKSIPLTLQLGACMPDTCSELDNTIFVHEALVKFGLNETFVAPMAECRTDERHASAATIICSVILAIIGVLMILGTAYDVVVIQWPEWKAKAAEEDEFVTNQCDQKDKDNQPAESGSAVLSNTSVEEAPLLEKPKAQRSPNLSRAVQALLSFSVYTNGSKILNTKQAPGTLKAISGIRFLSMSWVIYGHLYTAGFTDVDNFASTALSSLKQWTKDVYFNAFFSVDTFFAMSGLVTAYGLVRTMKKRGWKLNWGFIYFHRYWRLTPPYMLTILLVNGFRRYLGSGALWPNVNEADEACEKYWWAYPLYINNLIIPAHACFRHAWFLANDMQFFIISPLLVIPFHFSVYAGIAVCSLFLLSSWTITGILSTVYQWPASPVSMAEAIKRLLGHNTIHEYGGGYYIKPWCRLGPVFVGVIIGGILANKRSNRIRMKRSTVVLGWAAATTAALACIYGLRDDIAHGHPDSFAVTALYNAVARSVWGACICWVIVACVSGYGGFVNTILTWKPFVPLSRMTYMAYLIHPLLLRSFYESHEKLFYITDVNMVVTYCGLLSICYMVAFVLMLFFESPLSQLEKVFLPQWTKE